MHQNYKTVRREVDKDGPSRKRPRILPASCIIKNTLSQGVRSDSIPSSIEHWAQEGSWPKEYFEQDNETRRDFKQDSWFKIYIDNESNMSHLLARKRCSSLRRKQSESGDVTPSSTTTSDQKQREVTSAPYQHPGYETLLATKGSYMRKSEFGTTNACKNLCQTLIEVEQIVPQVSVFRDDLFDKICEKIKNRNEAIVIQDIAARLIVPSAQNLAIYGATNLEHLIESINEGWNNSIPVTKTRPQPDYSLGFKRSAFTDEQLKKIEPFVGGLYDVSYFMATWQIYFPFLTCEVKCGAAALDVADRQNAHSMTLAVRGVIELYRLVKREKELHREILAFSISHDHKTVRIYGHYALIEDDKTTFYRHPIKDFGFPSEDGKDKWTAYKFTKNIYEVWMPRHLKRICSAVDQIPADINFEPSQAASFSQEVSQQSSISVVEENHGLLGSQEVTPNTSLTQETERHFKKQRISVL